MSPSFIGYSSGCDHRTSSAVARERRASSSGADQVRHLEDLGERLLEPRPRAPAARARRGAFENPPTIGRDRVDLPAADRRQQVVAEPLDPQRRVRPGLEPALRHLDRAVEPEEVGRGQQVDVQHVALDPLGAVQEAPQLARARRDLDLEQPLEPVDRAHLIRDRADAADPRHDVGHLAELPAAQERLEEPRRLVDLQLEVA